MPYPALPPDPPPAIAAPAPACEVTSCNSLSEVAPEPASIQSIPADQTIAAVDAPVRPTSPERFEPEFSQSASTIEEFTEQSGESQAELLGEPTTAGYLQEREDSQPADDPTHSSSSTQPAPAGLPPTWRPDAQAADDLKARDRQTETPSPAAAVPSTLQPLQVEGATEQSDREALSKEPEAAPDLSSNSAPLPVTTYSVTGVAGKLADRREADLIRFLNQSLALDRLSQDLAPVDESGQPSQLTEEAETAPPAQQEPAPSLTSPTNSDTPATPNPLAPDLDAPTSPTLTIPETTPGTNPSGLPPELLQPSEPTTPQPGAQPLPGLRRIPGIRGLPTNQPTSPQPAPTTQPAPATPGTAPGQTLPPGVLGIIELSADRQDYDVQRQIFTAEGKVLMRFQGAILDADRLQVNLNNRIAVAEGNVALTRGAQVLRGNRFEYNFVQGSGTVLGARGEIFLPSADVDLNPNLASDATRGSIIGRPLSDRITANQPLQVVQGPGGVSITVGSGGGTNLLGGAGQAGLLNRLRFVADRLDFNPNGWEAANVQITNDPFSPPELILKADRAKLTRLSPLRDEVQATRPRLVFDQRLAVPIFLSRLVLDRTERQPPIARFGYDKKDRGGVFVERPFDVIRSPSVQLTLTPQIFLEKIFSDSEGVFDPSNFGLKGNLTATLSPTTTLRGSAVLTSLNPDDFDKQARASLRLNQRLGTHTLALETSYRDRLFNGSLGYQTVFSSIGAVLVSPVIQLGNTGINLTYQAGVQNVTARTDRLDLLPLGRVRGNVNLTRYQAAAALQKTFILWQGKALPATATEGLRYTPFPVQPYIALSAGATGVLGGYSNGDKQNLLVGSLQLSAQFGNFSRPFLDYTAFNIAYSQQARQGESPFFFDRAADNRVLSLGFTQQLYGPFRFGIQAAYNLDNGQTISTDYILEYSRRTYGLLLRYNPQLQIGSLNLRISDFNWAGGTEPFVGSGVTPVERGIIRTSDY